MRTRAGQGSAHRTLLQLFLSLLMQVSPRALAVKSNEQEMSTGRNLDPALTSDAGSWLNLKHFQPKKHLMWGEINPDPNSGVYNLEGHMENIWLIIFCFTCLQSTQNSSKHVGFVTLIVLNKNSVTVSFGRMLTGKQCQYPSNSDWL